MNNVAKGHGGGFGDSAALAGAQVEGGRPCLEFGRSEILENVALIYGQI